MNNQANKAQISVEKIEKQIISLLKSLRSTQKKHPLLYKELITSVESQAKNLYKLLPNESKNRINSFFPEISFS